MTRTSGSSLGGEPSASGGTVVGDAQYLSPALADRSRRARRRAQSGGQRGARPDVAAALDAVDAPSPASIGLILSDDAELGELNATHMGKTGPTDVLSFPLLPPAAFAAGAGTPDVPRPPGRRLHLGDIVVSVERAVEQAEGGRGGQTGDVRWSAADELRLLVTHGTLHVCGYDHAEPDEEARDARHRAAASSPAPPRPDPEPGTIRGRPSADLRVVPCAPGRTGFGPCRVVRRIA